MARKKSTTVTDDQGNLDLSTVDHNLLQYKDITGIEISNMLDKECFINFSKSEYIIDSIQEKLPNLNKTQISMILIETVRIMRESLILGIPITIAGFFSNFRFVFHKMRKAGYCTRSKMETPVIVRNS